MFTWEEFAKGTGHVCLWPCDREWPQKEAQRLGPLWHWLELILVVAYRILWRIHTECYQVSSWPKVSQSHLCPYLALGCSLQALITEDESTGEEAGDAQVVIKHVLHEWAASSNSAFVMLVHLVELQMPFWWFLLAASQALCPSKVVLNDVPAADKKEMDLLSSNCDTAKRLLGVLGREKYPRYHATCHCCTFFRSIALQQFKRRVLTCVLMEGSPQQSAGRVIQSVVNQACKLVNKRVVVEYLLPPPSVLLTRIIEKHLGPVYTQTDRKYNGSGWCSNYHWICSSSSFCF